MPPTRSSGMKTIATMMIPMPPNHCNIERQSSKPRGSNSSFVKTVEPVVVMPDIASKTASTRRASVAPIRNGIAPKIGSATQTSAAMRNVCCRLRLSLTPLRQARATSAPVNPVTIALSKKIGQ